MALTQQTNITTAYGHFLETPKSVVRAKAKKTCRQYNKLNTEIVFNHVTIMPSSYYKFIKK